MSQSNSNRWYYIVVPILVALIPAITNIFMTIWLNSGINSIRKDIKSTEILKTKASLFHTLHPNVEVNLSTPALSFIFNEEIELETEEDIKDFQDRLNELDIEIDKETTFSDIYENLNIVMEEYGIEIEKDESMGDLIVLEFTYCVENSGEFTQFVHIPNIYTADKPKNELESYNFNKHELAPKNDPIATLVPKKKGCNVVKAKLGENLYQRIKNVPNEKINLIYKFELKIEPHMEALMFIYENKEEAKNIKKQLGFYHNQLGSTNSL